MNGDEELLKVVLQLESPAYTHSDITNLRLQETTVIPPISYRRHTHAKLISWQPGLCLGITGDGSLLISIALPFMSLV